MQRDTCLSCFAERTDQIDLQMNNYTTLQVKTNVFWRAKFLKHREALFQKIMIDTVHFYIQREFTVYIFCF